MLSLRSTIERWPMKEPFEIARETMTKLPLLAIKLTDQNGVSGHAEAAGVDYDGETPASMAAQIEAILQDLHTDIAGDALNCLLPSGGARNAVDCALWDLRAKRNGVPAWQSSGLAPLRPVLTAFTIGLGSAEETRQDIGTSILLILCVTSCHRRACSSTLIKPGTYICWRLYCPNYRRLV
jgi:L-alanine-DL-glutamate epimerase-like enolase superfamily enzyme